MTDDDLLSTDPDLIRVASVPGSHVYVRHLAAPAADGVQRLPDPPPTDGRKVPGGWWPPGMLDGGDWIDRHHDEFDVFHVHFGFDAITLEELQRSLDALDRHGKPLVFTVHDLRNPHQPDPQPHLERLEVLMAQAKRLVTLTPGAAERIAATWSRPAEVLPHPHVLPSSLVGTPRRGRDGFVVGMHAKSGRACMDPVLVAGALVDAVAAIDGARLQLNVHDEVFDPDAHFYDPAMGQALLDLGRHPFVDVRVHAYFDDAQLWDYLQSLDVSVLPYRFGSHSGWLEACYDLGTAVVAPSCGFYAEQKPCATYELTETTWDPESLTRAVRACHDQRAPQATWEQRLAERTAVAEAHRALYADVLA